MSNSPWPGINTIYSWYGSSSSLGVVRAAPVNYFELEYNGKIEELREINLWMGRHFGISGLFPNGKPRWFVRYTTTIYNHPNGFLIRVYRESDFFKVKMRFG